MISLDLAGKCIAVLEEKKNLSKMEIIEIINLLKEFKAIEKKMMELRGMIQDQMKRKTIDKYIEVDSKIYCLESLEEFEVIPVEETKLIEIAEIQKELDMGFQLIDDFIDKEQNRLDDLLVLKEKLAENIFSGHTNKAVKNNEMLVIQKIDGHYETIFKEE